MTFIENEESFEISMRRSWICKRNNQYRLQEIAAFMALVSKNGQHKNAVEVTITTLIAMFTNVEGLLEMFLDYMDHMDLETYKDTMDLNRLRDNKKYRSAINSVGVNVVDYIYMAKKIAKESGNDLLYESIVEKRGWKKYEDSYDFHPQYKIINKEAEQTPTVEENPPKDKNISIDPQTYQDLDAIVTDTVLKQRIIDDYEKQRKALEYNAVMKRLREKLNKSPFEMRILDMFHYHTEAVQTTSQDEESSHICNDNDSETPTQKSEGESMKKENTTEEESPIFIEIDPMEKDSELSKKSLEILENPENIRIYEKREFFKKEKRIEGYNEEEIEEMIERGDHLVEDELTLDDVEDFDEDAYIGEV